MTGKPNIDYWVSRIPSTLLGGKKEGGQGPAGRSALKFANGNYASTHNNLIKGRRSRKQGLVNICFNYKTVSPLEKVMNSDSELSV